MTEIFKTPLAKDDIEELKEVCKNISKKISTRITVIAPSGKPLADTHKRAEAMDNHNDRPEVIQALTGEVGIVTRFSYTVGKDMMYVALPIKQGDEIKAVIRAAAPIKDILLLLKDVRFHIAAGILVIVLFAALASLIAARRVNGLLGELKEGAQRFASGELDYRLPVPPFDEIAYLVTAMNDMAQKLDDRIKVIASERNESEAILAGMAEAVIVIDVGNRIIKLNDSCEKLFGIAPAAWKGKSIYEIIRNPVLLSFVERIYAGDSPVEGAFVHREGEEKYLTFHGSKLKNDRGENIGALIVLRDTTRIKRLERIRKDFVANVSHELKTPITSIKGFLETLMESKTCDPEEIKKFIEIALKHTNRLDAIIEDLLSLSKIEQEAEKGEITLKEERIKEVLETAVALCSHKADEKKIRLTLDCPDETRAKINRRLIEQAVANLIDNGVKYSNEGKEIVVKAAKDGDKLALSVTDFGCGIPKEHLPRIFERFYRVDKSRSRKLGGTGLGLAIVKHIAQAHRGTVAVESELNRGSTFTLRLPLE
ncbi:MAG: ATP-binding protein [Myxococcota bacterium]